MIFWKLKKHVRERMIRNIVDNAEKGGYERENIWQRKNMDFKWNQREKWRRNIKHFIKFLNNLNADNAIINKFQDNL